MGHSLDPNCSPPPRPCLSVRCRWAGHATRGQALPSPEVVVDAVVVVAVGRCAWRAIPPLPARGPGHATHHAGRRLRVCPVAAPSIPVLVPPDVPEAGLRALQARPCSCCIVSLAAIGTGREASEVGRQAPAAGGRGPTCRQECALAGFQGSQASLPSTKGEATRVGASGNAQGGWVASER